MKDRTTKKNILKASIFLIGMHVFGWIVGYVLQPAWFDWNNYDTIHGFYQEPENTIETVFLGSSVMLNGITPTELYEEFGICAYNLATTQQPMLASYYWLREAHRLQSESLKTVVLDASMLRRLPDLEMYRRSLEPMKMSAIKYQAVSAYADDFIETLTYLIPLSAYHMRWYSLTKSDFERYGYKTNTSVRGYHFVLEQYLDTVLEETYEAINIPAYYIADKDEETILETEALYYLKEMIDFCGEKNIKLVLIKTPTNGYWIDSDHNAVENIAEQYELEFLDFNYDPLLSEMEYNCATDNIDPGHMNYYGANKLTAWMGQYLVEQCGATDVRGEQKYAYLEEQLEEYRQQISTIVGLVEKNEPVEYMTNIMKKQRYSILVMVKQDAARAMSEEQREGFAQLGLIELSKLQFTDSYLAVVNNGVIYEASDHYENAEVGEVISEIPINDLENVTLNEFVKVREQETGISYSGDLKDGKVFSLKSGGLMLGDIASCVIDGTQYAKNKRGINIVVYDNVRHEVVDSTWFDTYEAECRESRRAEIALDNALLEGKKFEELTEKLQQLYLYNLGCKREKEAILLKNEVGNNGMLKFLNYYKKQDNVVILISVKDDAAGAFNDAIRNSFRNIGLSTLSELQFRDSYVAIIDDSKIIYEQRGNEEDSLAIELFEFSIESGGLKSGNMSSIKINGIEYSEMQRGFNIVVYDKELQEVINSANFDTCAIPIKVE